MKFYHTKCGGIIDTDKRRCTRCKKKWNLISFRLDPTGIRPMIEAEDLQSKTNKRLQKASESKFTQLFIRYWWSVILAIIAIVLLGKFLG